VAASSGACSSSSGSTEAVITAHWPFTHVDGTASGQCDPNFPTAAIYSQPWDPVTNELLGVPFIDKFDCSDMRGTTDPLDGIFLVWIQIEDDTNPNNPSIYVKSRETYIDTLDGDLSLDFPILDNGGYFFLTWDLVDAQSQAPLTCAEAGIGKNGAVETVATLSGPDTGVVDMFTCEHGFGTTKPLLEGSYEVTVDAFDGTRSIGQAPQLSNKMIDAPGGLTDLGHILIPID
jgi:hypothetical protein